MEYLTKKLEKCLAISNQLVRIIDVVNSDYIRKGSEEPRAKGKNMKNIDKLNNLIKEYQSIRGLVAEAKAEQDAIAGAIKAIMDELDLIEYVSPTGRALYKEQTSYPIDTRALKAELPEIAERYSIERVTRPLKVA